MAVIYIIYKWAHSSSCLSLAETIVINQFNSCYTSVFWLSYKNSTLNFYPSNMLITKQFYMVFMEARWVICLRICYQLTLKLWLLILYLVKKKKVLYQMTEGTDKHTTAVHLLKLMIQVWWITKSELIHVKTWKNEKEGNQHLFCQGVFNRRIPTCCFS